MMNYLVIYPHCYTTKRGKFVFILNPKNKEYIIFKSDLAYSSNPMCFPIKQNASFCKIASICMDKGLGYIVENLNVAPFVQTSSFRFISSMPKIKKALGYNDGLKILDYITTINIHVPSNEKTLQYEDYYVELDYPKQNDSAVFVSFLNTYSFPNLKKILLSGDLDKSIIEIIRTRYPKVNIEYRTIILKRADIALAEDLAAKYQYFLPSLYISPTNAKSLFTIANNTHFCNFYPLIENIEDLTKFEDYECKLFYFPLLHSCEQGLISELTFNKNRLLDGNYELDSIFENEICNQYLYGNITLTCNGDIVIGNEIISNISKDWISDFMNFLYTKSNSWNETRNKKIDCKNCLFHALCPPISVYERLGYIKKACSD